MAFLIAKKVKSMCMIGIKLKDLMHHEQNFHTYNYIISLELEKTIWSLQTSLNTPKELEF